MSVSELYCGWLFLFYGVFELGELVNVAVCLFAVVYFFDGFCLVKYCGGVAEDVLGVVISGSFFEVFLKVVIEVMDIKVEVFAGCFNADGDYCVDCVCFHFNLFPLCIFFCKFFFLTLLISIRWAYSVDGCG